ncbi:ABC transporter ATP-binding protein [Parachryseolinea silvisoli]|jgi:ABC-type lipoprotein export system ATPase subunit|uniref:ABC transporter ATP-binding protein n=1 Tax=Parachryseolinea silvisoli TaxID=2873601 RepID=UPI002265A7F7|nr:ABC transporter ATP-binding protein [Parachryseolinea silvisoli]MCD9014590.1 ABC transporter ATP-binding protein [Parachryseolinea silvisoli]
MISVRNLSYQYDGTSRAIQFQDFSIPQGEHGLLLGESGSGKTTLLHVIGGLLRKYSGTVSIQDTALNALSEAALDGFRGRHIGFIFQRNHLISALTVEKNLALSPYLAGLPIDAARIDQVLASLGLQEKKKSRISELSHGQAQRVAIARAVLNKPSIILADEPTSALDDKNCERVITLLTDVARQNGATLLVATHDQRLKDRISNRIDLTTAP